MAMEGMDNTVTEGGHLFTIVTGPRIARVTDPTMAHSLSTLTGRQCKATDNLEEEVSHFLYYCATHPNTGIQLMASDMVLTLHLNASYLYEPDSKSRVTGHFCLPKYKDKILNNGAVKTLSKIIKHVLLTTAEAKTTAILLNCKSAQALRVSFKEIDHPQPKIPVATDNTTAVGLIQKTMIPKKGEVK